MLIQEAIVQYLELFGSVSISDIASSSGNNDAEVWEMVYQHRRLLQFSNDRTRLIIGVNIPYSFEDRLFEIVKWETDKTARIILTSSTEQEWIRTGSEVRGCHTHNNQPRNYFVCDPDRIERDREGWPRMYRSRARVLLSLWGNFKSPEAFEPQ